MEQKKQIKIKLSTTIALIIIIFALIILGVIYFSNKNKKNFGEYQKYEYWYSGRTLKSFSGNNESWEIINTYDEYKTFKNKIQNNVEAIIKNDIRITDEAKKEEINEWKRKIPKFTKKFFDSHSVIVLDINATMIDEVELIEINIGANVAQIKYRACISSSALVQREGVVYYIVIDNKIDTVDLDLVSESKNNVNLSMDAKPILYFYPEETTNVTVKVGKPENLTHTYPRYKNGWNVVAEPNSKLIDVSTGRNFYALYWEGINTVEPKTTEGFVVKGEDTIEFLEEKLKILGLSDREVNEFIIYWLPQMENNNYNFIRFQTKEEIEENMPLNIEPKPDNVIRVMMEWKALEQYINIPEQNLETPDRSGFVVVEWGGTEIK